MALGDIKTFDILYSGLTLKVNAVDMGGGITKFFIECLDGFADLNALYWGDDVKDSSNFDLGTKKDNSLNMNGSGVDFDGGMKLSDAGLGTAGVNKSTYITAGETLSFTGNVNWDDVDVFGVRATSTSTAEGSIKGTDSSGSVTTAPHITINDVTVTEGVDPQATFTISLDHAYLYDITLNYSTGDVDAIVGSDYTGASQSVTILAGQTSVTVSIGILDDLLLEPTETFHVNLSGATADLPGPDLVLPPANTEAFGIGTILDNDLGGGGGNPPHSDDFPTWLQDISHVVLYFDQEEGDVKGPGDQHLPDGYYTVSIAGWPGAATNDLDDNLDEILQYLIAHDPNITADSDLLGALIKGGTQSTQFYAYGDHNLNGTAADPIPDGAPGIVTPPSFGNSDGPSIDAVWQYSDIFA